ncbi:MAG: NAD(P)/FAD-dependent oxidoreductase, partial [Bacteroidia bacterium]
MSEVISFDVIILGAGPAGSTAVLALKNSNLKVAVIEKEIFPRDKICGDAVSSVVKRVLRQIDPELETQLEQLEEKVYISKAKLFSPEFRSLEFHFSRKGHCIKRMIFDNWLFEKAKQNKNVEFFQGVNVSGVLVNNDFVEVITADEKVFQFFLLPAIYKIGNRDKAQNKHCI